MGYGRPYPAGLAVSEKYVYLVDPGTKAEMEALRVELAKEQAKEPTVREVIKEVASPVNEEILAKYNSALREIGALKSTRPRLLAQSKPEVEIRTEFKEVERVVEKRVVVINRKILTAASLVSAMIGAVIGSLI